MKRCFIMSIIFIIAFQSISYADLTQKQGEDIALFAQKFIEKGNSRLDEKGYPLITYALTNNFNTNIKIRDAGYNEQLYRVKNIPFYLNDLGNKWCMDCGTFVSYIFKVTLGLDMYLGNEPWHVSDMYDDACKEDSKYFYFVYKQTPISQIDYSNLKIGDVIARVTNSRNHVMLYIGDGMVAHTNGDLIKYKAPFVSGFTISRLDEYYTTSTNMNVLRIKDGIIPEDYVVGSKVVWPDTGKEEHILGVPMSVISTENVIYTPKVLIKDFFENNTLDNVFFIMILGYCLND